MPTPSIHAFAEKVALITDGTSPIGRAVALQLALQGGYVVVVFDKSSDENRRALQELKLLGTLANAVEADISTVEGAKKAAAEVEAMFGRIDFLVNCLKFQNESAFDETGEEIFTETINANLKSAFFIVQAALNLMKPRPKPKIVNVVSALDTPETSSNVLFSASQNALIGLTKSLAENLPKNFRVNAVAVSEKKSSAEDLDAELFRPKTAISADDVARTILFLLSSESIGVNGQILKIE